VIFGYSFVQGLLSDTLAHHVSGGFLLAVTPVVLTTLLVIAGGGRDRLDGELSAGPDLQSVS
jgi:hypothetical protein